MKNKGFTKYRLVHKHGIAQHTISRMVKNMPTSSRTIDDLCKILDCRVEDIITFIPDAEHTPIE
ncbi:MAG: helix-turn-helix transcriptional regulator [Defluviitaleaceae bacterium]|nr:helix-turn-helix transcriptional regulator [Defluviitaleaceae bacterium]